MKTFDEIIKQRYPFYNPDIEQKDVELNGEQVKEMMRQAASQAIDRYCINAKAMVGNRTFEQIAELTKSELQ